MDFNFGFWLQAFSNYMTGKSDKPPVPPPHLRPKMPPQPPVPPPVQPDNGTLRAEEIYLIPREPEGGWRDPEPVPRITLTKEEAVAQGWRFRTKGSRRAKITHYRGTERDIVVPAQIGKYRVNEICAGAFEKAQIDCVRIPETVLKLGERCFAHSSVQKLVINAPAEEIPTEFADCCGRLSEVQLHYGINVIRSFAFAKCVNLRQLSIHPRYSARIEWCAFRESGLQAFSCKVYGMFMYGDAFEQTPLSQRYKLIMQETGKQSYEVVLVGRKADSLRMPAVNLHFCARSIPNRKGGLHRLDCADCSSVRFRNEAIRYTYASDLGTLSREQLFIRVPKNTGRFFFADDTDVRYADGTQYTPLIRTLSEDDSETVYELYDEELPAFALHPKAKNIRLTLKCYSHYSYREQQIYYKKASVFSRVLERMTFEVPLCGEEPLFAEECRSLHYVSWKQGGQQVEVYLPSADVIGERVHWYLLKAFHGYYGYRENRLLRSGIFDRVFQQQDNTGVQPEALPPEETGFWVFTYFRKAGVPVLKQRQKILLAVDVLRSTPELFPEREMYRQYLLHHRRCAMRLCAKLPEEYADFLRGFYEVIA